MCPAIEIKEIRCPHCGVESSHDDDLCRFCGKFMASSSGEVENPGRQSAVSRFLKGKVCPLTREELDETLISADFNNPANPIWDD